MTTTLNRLYPAACLRYGLFALSFCAATAINIAAADADKAPETSRTAFDDIIWDMQPKGRVFANIKGDFKTGQHTKIIKFSAGQKTAAHAHSHSYIGIVVKGRARHFEPGKPDTETILPPGSFWNVPADAVHISECLPGEDCIFVTEQEGLFDVKSAPAARE